MHSVPGRPRRTHTTGAWTTLSVGPVLGHQFQPQGTKQDKTAGMAEPWQTLCPVPLSSTCLGVVLPPAPLSNRFFTATMAQAAVPGRCQAHPGLKLPPLLSEGIKTPETLGWRWGTGGGLSERDEWLHGVTHLAPGAPHHKCHWHGSAQTAFQGSPGSPGCHRNPRSAESILKGGAGPHAEFITLYSTRGKKKKKEKKAHPLCLCLRFLCLREMVPLWFVFVFVVASPCPQAWHSPGKDHFTPAALTIRPPRTPAPQTPPRKHQKAPQNNF